MKKKASLFAIFLICWLTYLTAYLYRVNFSSAMQTVSGELVLSIEQLGCVGAVFYAVYAIGQLVNGTIGDHVPAPLFLCLALLGTAICNLGHGHEPFFGTSMLMLGTERLFSIHVLVQHHSASGTKY